MKENKEKRLSTQELYEEVLATQEGYVPTTFSENLYPSPAVKSDDCNIIVDTWTRSDRD